MPGHTAEHRNRNFDPFASASFGFAGQPAPQGVNPAQLAVQGAASLNPTALALQGGGAIAKAIADFIGGQQGRKDAKFGRGVLKGQVGKDIFNVSDIAGRRKQSFIQRARPLAESANRKLGLRSGRAQEELISQFAGQEGDFVAELELRNAIQKALRDERIGSQFLSRG